ncbi:hypothetical protein YQE_08333, partial [Dendroctonus ponderosae]
MASPMVEFNFKAEDLVKAGRTSSYNIDGIRQWLDLLPTIPPLCDEQIAIFLIACKNDTEATKNCILCFFKYKAAAPEIFANREVESDELTQVRNTTNFAIMPQRTKENYAVLVGVLKDTSYSSFFVDSQVKLLYLLVELLLQDNPPDGLVVVLNLKGVGLMHITRLKISTVKKFFQFLQEAMPTQLKQIHIINSSYVFDKILMVLKPFMNRDLFDMIVPHSSSDDMDAFYANHLSRDLLPADLGGDLPNIDQLTEETLYQCRKSSSYLNSYERQIEEYQENSS